MGAALTYPAVELAGKVALVTGGNTGIGYETAKALALMGAQTFIACRSEEKATAAIQRMQEEVSAEFPDKAVQVEFLPLDLSSFHSTREFVSAFRSKNLPLHILVNNAGVWQLERDITPDGYERQYQVNHLSPFLLTLELLPCVREAATATGDARIVFVSSVAHKNGVWDPSHLNGEKFYSLSRFYGNSKLYNIMTSFGLQRRLQNIGVTVSCLHPGVVNTELFRQYEGKWYYPIAKPVANAVLRNVKQGAATTINCAVNPDLNTQQCVYYADCRPAGTINTARDRAAQEELWAVSVAAVKEFLSPEAVQRYGQTQQTGQSETTSGARPGQPELVPQSAESEQAAQPEEPPLESGQADEPPLESGQAEEPPLETGQADEPPLESGQAEEPPLETGKAEEATEDK